MAVLSSKQLPNEAILDFYNKQAYLGNEYVIGTDITAIASANVETPLLYLINPASNGVAGKNTGCFINIRKFSQATNVSAATTIFRTYFNPTITANGTAATPVNVRPGLGNSSSVLAYRGPSACANGTVVSQFAVNYQELDTSVLYILDPGQSLLVTGSTDTAGTKVLALLNYYEL